jgi:hypothetical protein
LSRDLGEPIEMRKDFRFWLDAPAVFSWEDAGHRRFQGEGVTRDVTVHGAFILTATMPPPDCPIHIDILLPLPRGIKTMVRISGKARDIRVDHPSSDTRIHGFAVVTDELNQWGLVPIDDKPKRALVGDGLANRK